MAIGSRVYEFETVYDAVQNPKMMLLREKGAHGVSAQCKEVRMLLPQWSQGSTLKNDVAFIANSTTFASQCLSTWPAPAKRLGMILYDSVSHQQTSLCGESAHRQCVKRNAKLSSGGAKYFARPALRLRETGRH